MTISRELLLGLMSVGKCARAHLARRQADAQARTQGMHVPSLMAVRPAVDPEDDAGKPWLCMGLCVALITVILVGVVVIAVLTNRNSSGNDQPTEDIGPTELRMHTVESCSELFTILREPVTQLGPVDNGFWASQWGRNDRPWVPSSTESVIQGSPLFAEV